MAKIQTSAKFWSGSIKKDKKQYLAKLNIKKAADNKLFSKNSDHILAITALIQQI